MLTKLHKLEQEYEELIQKLSDPGMAGDQAAYRTLGKRKRELEKTVMLYRQLKDAQKQADEAKELLISDDGGIRKLAEEELAIWIAKVNELTQALKRELIPRDQDDQKDCIMEIRAGTGGEEAAIFASDLCRMYMRYAERSTWKVELLSKSDASAGGYKEIVFAVRGDSAYGKLKYESGVHRVQRIPMTEA